MKDYCCREMEEGVAFKCEQHADKYECPDVLVSYSEVFEEYGLIIHDGGTSVISIYHCPWCGIRLPESKRDLWFDTLEKLGFDDPTGQDIPEEFRTGAWHEKV